MKIIPHPTLLKEREEHLDRIQSELAQRARELHVLEVMLNSQIESDRRDIESRRLSILGFFLAGFISGFLISFFIF